MNVLKLVKAIMPTINNGNTEKTRKTTFNNSKNLEDQGSKELNCYVVMNYS